MITAAALLAAFFIGPVGPVTPAVAAVPQRRLDCYTHRRPTLCLARWWRRDSWRLQSDLTRPRTPRSARPLASRSPAFQLWAKRLWKNRARRLDVEWPPWSAAWIRAAACVHSHEASWANPGGIGPDVSGGMQIGRSEWQHFGGTYWTPEAFQTAPRHQLLVAFRYYSVAGWEPWPNTAAMCGLL